MVKRFGRDAKSVLSRRDMLIAAIGVGPVLALSSTAAQAKMAQVSVGYQEMPKDDKECDGCNFFVAPNACKVVDGEINPKGYCKLWNKKPAA